MEVKFAVQSLGLGSFTYIAIPRLCTKQVIALIAKAGVNFVGTI